MAEAKKERDWRPWMRRSVEALMRPDVRLTFRERRFAMIWRERFMSVSPVNPGPTDRERMRRLLVRLGLESRRVDGRRFNPDFAPPGEPVREREHSRPDWMVDPAKLPKKPPPLRRPGLMPIITCEQEYMT